MYLPVPTIAGTVVVTIVPASSLRLSRRSLYPGRIPCRCSLY